MQLVQSGIDLALIKKNTLQEVILSFYEMLMRTILGIMSVKARTILVVQNLKLNQNYMLEVKPIYF